MATRWIDFAALKRHVLIRDVLERYGLLDTLRETKPGKLVGPCPVHKGTNSTSFHVDCGFFPAAPDVLRKKAVESPDLHGERIRVMMTKGLQTKHSSVKLAHHSLINAASSDRARSRSR